MGSAAAVKSYHRVGLATSDYYIETGQIPGYWNGQGAERLGLKGKIEQQHFDRLVDNIKPLDGSKLNPRHDANRRVGYDLTFNAPKSVSILYALSGEQQRQAIQGVFQLAVQQAMAEVEQHMYVRVRKNKQNTERHAGNMLWSLYVHPTTRPLKNGIPDPHLHGHAVCFNSTCDVVESQWKAAEFGHIYKHIPYFEAVFHNHLAHHIKQLGYGIEPTHSRCKKRTRQA